VLGSGTVLDTARLKYALGEHLGVDSRSVHSFIIGEHGDSEIAAWSSTNVSGIPLNDFCEMRGHFNHDAAMDAIAEKVKNSAYEIISKKQATYYGIAMSVKRICECIVRNERSILPVSAMMHGEYGIEDITPLKSLKSLISVDLDGNSINAEALYSLLDALTEDITLHLMQGQSIDIENRVVDIQVDGKGDDTYSHLAVIVEAEASPADGVVFDAEQPSVLTGKEAGEYRVTVTFEGKEAISPLVKEMTMVVHAPEAPVAEVSSNIPELGDWVHLLYYNGNIENYYNDSITAGDSGFTALYPSGELYYIDEAQEIQFSDHAKDYTYVGKEIYPDQVNILEQDGSLWEWRWEKGAAQPEKTRVAENIVEISGDAAVDAEGALWIDGRWVDTVDNVTGLTENAERILKADGTVWENVEGCYEQIDQNVKAFINAWTYVKNDNTTWVNDWAGKKQIADFGATDVTEATALDYIDQDGQEHYDRFYFAVDEAGAVWKIRVENPSDCVKIEKEEENPPLRADKSLWFMFHSEDYYDRKDPIGEPFLLLSDVEAYRAHSGFGLYPHIMTRSDGSIWGYRFNEASMDYPVMIKAPIGAESFTLGDVNLDGKVNTTDARLALRGAAKLEALTPQQILAADVNKNGKADTSDARKILRVAAKLDQF
jgi:hypothetical protein